MGWFRYFLPSTRRRIEAAHTEAIQRHVEATQRIDRLCEQLGRVPRESAFPTPNPEHEHVTGV